MTLLDEAEHAAASGDPAAALRDTRAAELQWCEYGFGPWAYIDEGDNAASRQLAAKLGFVVRGQGRGRSGEPMTVYELRRDVWQRRGG